MAKIVGFSLSRLNKGKKSGLNASLFDGRLDKSSVFELAALRCHRRGGIPVNRIKTQRRGFIQNGPGRRSVSILAIHGQCSPNLLIEPSVRIFSKKKS